MPPKGWRKTATGFQPTNSAGVNIKDRKTHTLEELQLPRSIISKMAKEILPENSQLPRDGVTALRRSAVMFISYITSEANLIANNESRKTITHNDILRALDACHFGSVASAATELSEKMEIGPKSSKVNNAGKLPASSRVAKIVSAAEPAEDEYHIEEDLEPSVDFDSIHHPLAYADIKRARLEGSGQDDMQIDP